MSRYRLAAYVVAIVASSCHCRTGTMPDDRVTISPAYADSIYFVVTSTATTETKVKGDVKGFHDNADKELDTYFQRFVKKEGSFRIIHTAGTEIKTTTEFGNTRTERTNFNDTIGFNELGIFNTPPGDPVDLIPLYPGHPVKQGETWDPSASVKIAFGTGRAKYRFMADSIFHGTNGDVLARVKVSFAGSLSPSGTLPGGEVDVSGSGWLIWDCRVNQRTETHISAIYSGQNKTGSVKRYLTVNDKLTKYEGRVNF